MYLDWIALFFDTRETITYIFSSQKINFTCTVINYGVICFNLCVLYQQKRENTSGALVVQVETDRGHGLDGYIVHVNVNLPSLFSLLCLL